MKNIKSDKNSVRDYKDFKDFAGLIISADDHIGKNPLSIKETFIWLEESKIFFYKIRKSME